MIMPDYFIHCYFRKPLIKTSRSADVCSVVEFFVFLGKMIFPGERGKD